VSNFNEQMNHIESLYFKNSLEQLLYEIAGSGHPILVFLPSRRMLLLLSSGRMCLRLWWWWGRLMCVVGVGGVMTVMMHLCRHRLALNGRVSSGGFGGPGRW
jgi:hypothetical protein